MPKFIFPRLLLALICILFLFTRLYKITEVPASVYWDEASIGYNAYSIAQVGKDEWGKAFPLGFEAFGEYKLPVYIYTVSLVEKILGPSILAVRLPAAIFSLVSVILIYLIGKKIGDKESIGLWASFFAVLSPWFFIFSRTGYEATAGLMFYLLGIYAFLQVFKKKWMLILSSISFILSLFSYNAFRVITPITIIILIVFHWRIFLKKEHIIVLVISFLLFFGSFVFIINSGQATARLDEVGILNNFAKKKLLIKQVFINYISHFSPQFLFIQGDKNHRSQQQAGQLYLPDLLLMLFGLLFIFRSRRRYGLLTLILLFISPLPASIAKEAPHALRSLSIVPFLSFLLAFGITEFSRYIKVKSLAVASIVIYIVLFTSYYNKFITRYTEFSAEDWQLSYKEAFEGYKEQFGNFDHIIITDHYGQPYIFSLFYLKYPPEKFLKSAKNNTTIRKKTSLVESFDKFIFTNIDYNSLPKGKSLIFAHPSERMDEIGYKQILYFPNNTIMFYTYEYQK